MSSKGTFTTLTGPVADQAALHGIISRVRDLGLPLISVNRIEPEGKEDTNTNENGETEK